MTDREKAIVMAHTGICMLAGDKFQIFHKYVEDIMGRPIWTHEMVLLADEIKEKSKADFIALCADESSSENPNKWIACSDRLPDTLKDVVIAFANEPNEYDIAYLRTTDNKTYIANGSKKEWVSSMGETTYAEYEVDAWMPIIPYQPEIPTGQIAANGELYPGEFDDPLATEGAKNENS